MSLDVYITAVRPVEVFEANITHNLGAMAEAAGLYKVLWRPDELEPPIKFAKDLIPYLEKGLLNLASNRVKLSILNPKNGWGSFDNLFEFTRNYLTACQKNPDGEIRVDR